jgi:hypothetical protein
VGCIRLRLPKAIGKIRSSGATAGDDARPAPRRRIGSIRISTEAEINVNVKAQRLSVAGKDIR